MGKLICKGLQTMEEGGTADSDGMYADFATDHLMTLTNNQNKGGSAYSMLIPNLRRYLDYPHTASIACPKPTLFFNGTRDKLFPIEGVKDAYQTMRSIWESQNAGEQLVTKIWDEQHFFSKEMQKETLEFFNKWFK